MSANKPELKREFLDNYDKYGAWKRQDIASHFGVDLRTVHRWITMAETNKPRSQVTTPAIEAGWLANIDTSKTRYIITCAVNDSKLSKKLYACLRHMEKELDAQLLTIPVLYRNPDMYGKNDRSWGQWPSELAGTYINQDVQLTKYLRLIASFTINATAASPLTGLNGVAGRSSAIIGTPKQDQEFIAYGLNDLPRSYTGTGAITEPNYSASKAGGRATTFHKIGAVVVEVTEKGVFHLRHVEFRNGTVHDLSGCYTPKGKVPKARLINTVALGDVHEWHKDELAYKTAFEFVNKYRPRFVIGHDFIDASTVSPHDEKKGAYKYLKAAYGGRTLLPELESCYETLKELQADDREIIIPRSNHHDHLDRWLLNHGQKDETNYLLWTNLMAEYANSCKLADREFIAADAFKVAMSFIAKLKGEEGLPGVRFLELGEEFCTDYTDFTLHGHVGPGGSRGALSSFAKACRQLMVGHSHKPGRKGNALQIGTLSRMDRAYKLDAYNTWVHGVGVEYDNGAMTNVFFIEGDYRA